MSEALDRIRESIGCGIGTSAGGRPVKVRCCGEPSAPPCESCQDKKALCDELAKLRQLSEPNEDAAILDTIQREACAIIDFRRDTPEYVERNIIDLRGDIRRVCGEMGVEIKCGP